jgi:hypothetical protein
MGFAAPWFFIGALAVGLPLYLHLLRHSRGRPQHVPSVMLFEARPYSARETRRLRQWLLLALRLLVLLLLTLTFAAPYLNARRTGAGAQRLLLLAVDDSFSMRAGSRLEDARAQALAVLAASPITQPAQVLALAAQGHVLTPVTQDRHLLRAALAGISAADSRGSLSVLASAVRGIALEERQPIELHFFTDLQRTGLPAAFSEMALPPQVHLVLHPVAATPVPNWYVESVAVPKRVWDPHTTHIEAVIAGSNTKAATRTVTFQLNGQTVATRPAQVPPSGRATVALDSPELPHGFSRLTVSIDGADSLPADDTYLVAVERAERQRALFVSQSGDTRSPLYFSAALEAAEPRAVTLDKVTVERAGGIDPRGYAFVVISDVATLPAAFAERLSDYVRRGGAVLVTLGTVAAQAHTTPVSATPILAPHHYARQPERFAAVGQTDRAYAPAGAPAEWEGVRFYYAAALVEEGARVAVRLQDGTPLLMEKPLGEGRVVLFASSLDNLTNDLPLKPVFVAFVARLTEELTGADAHLGPQKVDDLLPLRTAREQAVGVMVIDPDGHPGLSFAESVSAQSYPLGRSGFYQVRVASGRTDLVAVNADRRESDLSLISPEILALWRGADTSPSAAPPPTPAAEPDAGTVQTTVQRSLWWYAMLGLMAAALAESVISGRLLAIKREDA